MSVLAKQSGSPSGRGLLSGGKVFKVKGMVMEKLKRGQKLCKGCNTINGVRSFNCKSCGNAFSMKKPPKNGIVIRQGVKVGNSPTVDYKSLSKGDIIKVLKGSGPYHTNESGEKTYLGTKGKYTVDSIVQDGIMVVNQNGAHEFLYMGEVVTSSMLNTLTRSPYKIILLKKKEVVNG